MHGLDERWAEVDAPLLVQDSAPGRDRPANREPLGQRGAEDRGATTQELLSVTGMVPTAEDYR